jgi:protein-disulfide isomerase/uncharacterized membrane protein
MTGRRIAFVAGLVLCGLGLLGSEYLLLRTFAVMAGAPPDAPDFCSAMLGTGCNAALASDASGLLGLPLAAWGVVFFGTLGLLLVAAWALGGGFVRRAARAGFVFACCGAIATAILAALFVTGRVPFCPLCTATHVFSWALVPILWIWARRAGVNEPEGSRGRSTAGFAAVALAGLLIWVWAARETAAQRHRFDPEQALRAHIQATAVAIPVQADDSGRGSPDAAAQLVIFSDFQCEGCREFAKTLSTIAEGFGDRLGIAYKHFPLSAECHPEIGSEMHPGACRSAWASHAAHLQGSFWKFHDRVFAAKHVDEAAPIAVARSIGLDLERFDADRRSPETKRKIAEDIALGLRLGVDGTPTVFLNGKRVRDLRPVVLGMLVAYENRVRHDSSATSTPSPP